jgi:hypothetical protein
MTKVHALKYEAGRITPLDPTRPVQVGDTFDFGGMVATVTAYDATTGSGEAGLTFKPWEPIDPGFTMELT